MLGFGYYNMDNVEGMRQFPDNYFDLAIVDPPYGIGQSGGKNKSRSKIVRATEYKDYEGNDLQSPSKEFFEELFRVSKNQIIWGANHFISKIPYDSSCWIVWDKVNGASDFADCELAWTSFNTAVRKVTFMWNGMMQAKNIKEGNIMQGNKRKNELRIHPNQKPVAIYEWLLSNYAQKGDIILDPNVGSASSLVACYNLGYDFVGFEIDTHYYKLSSERLKTEMSQMRLSDFI